jgi:hypothetical protein
MTRYVWLKIDYNYDDTSIKGVYDSLKAAMDKYPAVWAKVSNEEYKLKNTTPNRGETISRWEVEGEQVGD